MRRHPEQHEDIYCERVITHLNKHTVLKTFILIAHKPVLAPGPSTFRGRESRGHLELNSSPKNSQILSLMSLEEFITDELRKGAEFS